MAMASTLVAMAYNLKVMASKRKNLQILPRSSSRAVRLLRTDGLMKVVGFWMLTGPFDELAGHRSICFYWQVSSESNMKVWSG